VPSAGKRGSQGSLSCATVAVPARNREQDRSCRTKESVLGKGAVSIEDGEQPRCQLIGPAELRKNRPRAPLPLHAPGIQDIACNFDTPVGIPYRDAEEDSWGNYGDSPFPSGEDGREVLFLRRLPLPGAGSRRAVRRVTSGFPRPSTSCGTDCSSSSILERAAGAQDRAAALKTMEAFMAVDCNLDAETLKTMQL
jgi:hypothetical protein